MSNYPIKKSGQISEIKMQAIGAQILPQMIKIGPINKNSHKRLGAFSIFLSRVHWLSATWVLVWVPLDATWWQNSDEDAGTGYYSYPLCSHKQFDIDKSFDVWSAICKRLEASRALSPVWDCEPVEESW